MKDRDDEAGQATCSRTSGNDPARHMVRMKGVNCDPETVKTEFMNTRDPWRIGCVVKKPQPANDAAYQDDCLCRRRRSTAIFKRLRRKFAKLIRNLIANRYALYLEPDIATQNEDRPDGGKAACHSVVGPTFSHNPLFWSSCPWRIALLGRRPVLSQTIIAPG